MVPKGWSKLSLKKLLTLNYGKSPKEIIDENGAYDIVGTGGITGSTNKYLHSEPSVIIGRKGTIDKPQYLDKPFWAIDTTFYCVPIDNNKVDIKWFYQYSKLINWKNYNEASGVPSLSRETIYSIQVATPPITEQLKIVKVLSTWDKAISTTERLIDNSSQQKEALMQQLLTGKKRLLDDEGKRFEGEWEEGKLADFAKIKKGKALSSKDIKEGSYPVIAGGKSSPYTHSDFTHENVITVSASGAYAGYIAFFPYKIWASDCSVVEPKGDNNIKYLYYWLSNQQQKIYTLQSGGAQPHIYPRDLESMKISIPSCIEQQKIATVLTNADKEIELLKQQLADLQQEKKALMQVLLTGKKRVVVDEC